MSRLGRSGYNDGNESCRVNGKFPRFISIEDDVQCAEFSELCVLLV